MYKLLLKLKTLAFGILAIFFSLMWVLTLLLHGWAAPFPRLTPQKPLLLLGLAFIFFIYLMLVNRLSLVFVKKQQKKFIGWTLFFYTVFQIVFVVLFPVNAFEDAVIVNNIALQFLEGNYNSLGIGSYLGYYPNNIGITIFFAFLYSFLPDSNLTLRLVNVLFNTVSAWLIYKIYIELYPEKGKKAYGVLLLSVTFLPAVIMNNFTYGDICCNTFCLAAILNALRFTRTGLGKYALSTALFLMGANFMRSVAFLFMAAILLYWVLNHQPQTKYNLKNVAYTGLVVILFNLPLKLFSFVGVKTGIIVEPVGIHANPVWRWINMGFPGKKLGYWDGGRNIAIFVNRFKCDKHAASKYFIREIAENYRNNGLLNVFKAYFKKTFWLWTEGTYSVNFYGLSQALRADKFMLYSTPFIKLIEPWDWKVRLSLNWLLHSFNWLVLGLVSLYLFDAIKKRDFRMELFVYIIYFYIGFYMLWEVKSRYIFGVYPIFLIMGYHYSHIIYSKLFHRHKPLINRASHDI